MNRKLTNIALFIMVSLTLFLLLTPYAFAQESLNLPAESLLLIDAESGRVLYEENADQPRPPASITKLMTLLLAFEAIEEGRTSMEDMVTVSQEAWETGGSQMFLNIGEEVSFEKLLTGIAVVSANDACIAVAEHLAGSVDLFVSRMNARAAELGLTDTHFVDPHGLNDNNQMSARDIATLSRHLVNTYPQMRELDTIPEFEHNGIKQLNVNPLLGRYPGADGLKTGSTGAAGYNLSATAVQEGMRLIAVTLGSESKPDRLIASEGLLNYGFRNFRRVVVAEQDEVIASAEVTSGEERAVDAKLARDLAVVVPFGEAERIEKRIELQEPVPAPVTQGDRVGIITALLDGEPLGEVELIAAGDVPKAGFFTLAFRSIGDFFTGLWQSLINLIGF